MKQQQCFKYAYIAGLIDADGCIQIKRSSVRNNVNREYSLTVLVNQVDGQAIDFLYGVFGGSVFMCVQNGLGCLPVCRWQIRGKQARKMLKKILPFLKIKRNQAELGIRFQNHVDRYVKPRIGGRYTATSEREMSWRDKRYQEMRDMKRVHIPSAAVETKRKDSSIGGEAIVHAHVKSSVG